MGYKDLRSYLAALEAQGLLVRVDRPINKDTELMPLVRWQYRGLSEEQRKAFLFTNVHGSGGTQYAGAVAVSALGASRQVYAAALGCPVSEIRDTWLKLTAQRTAPVMVDAAGAPCKEVILRGDDLTAQDGGMARFPIPISTPGFDPAPYITSGHWVTKDPDTGIRNVGNYRGMVKAPNRAGIQLIPTQHVGIHFTKCQQRGKHLEAAIVIGAAPAIAMAAVAKIPYGVDEYEVAGSLMGAPVELVKCETVDLEVPASAEIVLEGYIRTDEWEPEAPFGEYTGYLGERRYHPIFEITCITHRRDPVAQAFISQFPPSESSKVRGIANEAVYYDLLVNHANIPSVTDVAFPEEAAAQHMVVIQMDKRNKAEPWQAMHACNALDPTYGKIAVVVDTDVNPRDITSIVWAIFTRSQPNRDWRIISNKASMLDPSAAPPNAPPSQLWYPDPDGAGGVMIDATRKWDYAPVSLPKQAFMENAREIWESLGLPQLNPRTPWYGYKLGEWPQEWLDEAEEAAQGRYFAVGEKLAKGRKPF
ncbi:MAG TPA: UbiD family decarboxylase [Symbiobacteriaceae bacterium]|nr:UbiD family decarboxylase [Symbiobacteriaceae bacterium]